LISDKKIVAIKSVNYIEDGMIVGLGSGSTVNQMLYALGQRINEGLKVKCIPASKKTERLAKDLNIPLTDFSKVSKIDLTIDGADEVDGDLNLIKGGGGSLVREKVVAIASDKVIIIVDHTKEVQKLGQIPIPIEIIPFGWRMTSRYLEELGADVTLRKVAGKRFVSDNGNYIVDCKFDDILAVNELNKVIKQTVGVVETGLFIEVVSKLLSAKNGQVKIIDKITMEDL